MSTDTLLEAVAELQSAAAKLQNAISALGEHDTNPNAHEFILNKINELTESGQIFTNDQIRQIVKEALDEHFQLDFKNAHPGWEEYETELNVELARLNSEIEAINNRLNVEVPGQEQTGYDQIIQAIADKYAPVIAQTHAAFKEAQANGDLELAQIHKDSMDKLLAQQQQETLEAMEKWLAENTL